MTPDTSNIYLSYGHALSITSIQFLTLRSATGAMTGKTCSTSMITKHIRPVVTEAYNCCNNSDFVQVYIKFIYPGSWEMVLLPKLQMEIGIKNLQHQVD